ncbi:MAG TPA: VWA domain-containing protein [Vicinamibacterales bacterium]|nr:VWA domain-containing protein [Vicinamibacterales bacterium]
MRIPALIAGVLALSLAAPIAARQSGQSPPSQPSAPPPQPEPPAQAETAPDDPPRAQQPIRTGINFVRVDVIVTDSKTGEPVLDLKPDEFSVAEDGKPQTIESFSVVKIDALEQAEQPMREIRTKFDEEREAARPDVRLFILLMDDYHVRRGNDMFARKPLIDFIQNSLGPADMVAVMYPLTPVNDLTFTRNRDALIRAVEQFEGRRFDYRPRNAFEEEYAYYPAQTVERIRNEVVMTALRGAAVKLGTMREGRKSIIFVSEGFTGNLPAQINDPVAAIPGFGNPNRGRAGVEMRNDRADFLTKTDMISDMSEIFKEANRNNTSIYAVDPRGLAAFEYDINQGVGLETDRSHLAESLDTLRMLADNTDGRAIVNSNDLATGMKQIIRDASGYYLLGYNSTQAPTDGRFHEIRVRVTRRGVDVRARKGYWAYTADDVARATAPPRPEAAPAVTAALAAIAEPVRGRAARFWLGTAPGATGRTRVTFVWEPVPSAPGERRATEHAPARVRLTATAVDGRPLYRGAVPEEAASGSAEGAPPVAAAAAQGASASFEAPPGQVQVRMVVESASGQVIDSATQEITLPDFTQVQVSLSTPQVFRARTARDAQNIRTNPAALPAVGRIFSRAERIFVRATAHAPGGVTPTFTARLLNRNGEPMRDVPVNVSENGADLDLQLSSLAAGDYLIELNAKTDAGTAQEMVGFRVDR